MESRLKTDGEKRARPAGCVGESDKRCLNERRGWTIVRGDNEEESHHRGDNHHQHDQSSFHCIEVNHPVIRKSRSTGWVARAAGRCRPATCRMEMIVT